MTTVKRNTSGEIHCTDGPAVLYHCGRKEWFVEGHRHRIDGPSIEDPYDDGRLNEWHVCGRRFTEYEFNLYVDQLTGDVLAPVGKRLYFD